MKLPVSNRLLACCSYVNQGDRVADVGADHGYLGIHLLLSGVASFVIASDIGEMPLQSARRNALRYGVADRMAFCLSDGVRKLPRDFDVLICAGMGADTILHILAEAPWLRSSRYRLVLQCQSRRPEFRRGLNRLGFAIRRETLAQDGKFLYPVTEAVYAPGQTLTPGGYYIPPALLTSGSPLLAAYYGRVVSGLSQAAAGLERSGNPEKLAQYRQILAELGEMEAAIYGDGS